MLEPTEGAALGQCYRLARQRAAERRQAMAEFNAADYAGGAWGWLADLAGQAQQKGMATTGTALGDKHRELYFYLLSDLQRRAAQ